MVSELSESMARDRGISNLENFLQASTLEWWFQLLISQWARDSFLKLKLLCERYTKITERNDETLLALQPIFKC